MSRAKHRAAKLLTGESPAMKFLISAFGARCDDPTLWFTFLMSRALTGRAAPPKPPQPLRVTNLFGGIAGHPLLPTGVVNPVGGKARAALARANKLRENPTSHLPATCLRALNSGQELFVELLLREFEKALKTGQASFFRSMADALETINQGKFADQPRLLVFFYCFDIVDGMPVPKASIPPTRSIKAHLREHGLEVDDRTIRRMKRELGLPNDAKRGRPVEPKLEGPLESGL